MNIKKLLNSPHITVRKIGIVKLYATCINNECIHDCKKCSNMRYYITSNRGRHYYLPNFIQKFLRKICKE